MPKKLNTVTYELKNGNEIVYVGITTNPQRCEAEHRREGMKFSCMVVTTRKMTEGSAKRLQLSRLKMYRVNQGRHPKYNKDEE